LKNYAGFIFSAYAFAAVVIGALIVKITLDYRDLRGKLDRFKDREERS
jgi:heme exporter protein CcmD